MTNTNNIIDFPFDRSGNTFNKWQLENIPFISLTFSTFQQEISVNVSYDSQHSNKKSNILSFCVSHLDKSGIFLIPNPQSPLYLK